MSTDYIFPPVACQPRDWRPEWCGEWPMLLQPKLNGVRCLLGPDGRAWSKTVKIYPGLVGQFKNPTGLWLDGEIVDRKYVELDIDEKPSNVLTLQTINGIVSRHNPSAEDLKHLTLCIFDVIVDDVPQYERLNLLSKEHSAKHYERLRDVNASGQHILYSHVATLIGKDPEHARKCYDALPEHAEGMIYRNYTATYEHGKSTYVLKRKKLIEKEFICVATHEGVGKYAGMFGGATLQLPDGTTFNCGGGKLSVSDRLKLQANPPIGKKITVRFPYYSDDMVPLQAQIEAVRDYE